MANQIPGTDDVPDVTPKPLAPPFNGNRATPEDFGADAGNSLNQAGELANQVATRARNDANLDAVLAARGVADNALNKQILDDTVGFRSLHGYDAQAASDKTLGTFDATLNKIGGGLANDDQRRTFAQYALGLKQEADRHVQGHLAQERQTIGVEAYKTAETALIQRLGSLPVAIDPAQQKQALDSIEISARARAVRVLGNLAPPETIAKFTVAARAKGVDQILETLLANENAPGALQRAKEVIKDPATAQLLGGARTAIIEGRIFRRADQQEGLAWARAAAQSSLYPGTSMIGDDADDKLATLAAQPDSRPEMLKVAENELQRLKVRGRQSQKDRNDNAFTIGINAVHNGDDKAFQGAVDKLSVPNAGTDAGEKLKALYDFQDKQGKKVANSPESIKAQSYALSDAIDILHNTRASETTVNDLLSNYKAADGRTFAEALGPKGTATFRTAFEKQRTGEEKDVPLSKSQQDQVFSSLKDAFNWTATNRIQLGAEDQDRLNHVIDYVRSQRNDWREENPNKQPQSEDIQRWAKEQILKRDSGHWYKSNSRVVDLEIAASRVAAATGQSPSAVVSDGGIDGGVPAAGTPAAIPPQPTAASQVAPTPAAAPPAKRITAYRYSKDRSQRIPVYDDGTQGHPEPNQ